MAKTGRKPKARDEEMYKRHMRHLDKEAILDNIRYAFSNADEKTCQHFGFLTSNVRRWIEELRRHCERYNG